MVRNFPYTGLTVSTSVSPSITALGVTDSDASDRVDVSSITSDNIPLSKKSSIESKISSAPLD